MINADNIDNDLDLLSLEKVSFGNRTFANCISAQFESMKIII